MLNKKYRLRYLPLFYKDLKKKVDYIADELHNYKAANDLLDEVENAIINRLPYAEAFEQYQSSNEREHPYYRIYVKNYVIYYVVIKEKNEMIMEIRRFLYNKEEIDNYIWAK